MPRAGFGPTIPASERSQTHDFDGVATGIVDCFPDSRLKYHCWLFKVVINQCNCML